MIAYKEFLKDKVMEMVDATSELYNNDFDPK
jgi:hypothetical protein